MRLLQAMAGAPAGGAETFFTRLALGLRERNVEQRIVLRSNSRRVAMLESAGIDVVTAPFGGAFDRATRRVIRRAIEDFAPTVVLTWMNRATAHCPHATASRRFVHIGTPRGYYDPKYYRHCDHLIVTTQDLMQFYVRSGWAADRVSVIPNFAPEARATSVSRAALDTPDDAPLLLALGRLHRNKGFDVLIGALARLPEHYLWLGGDGPLADELRDLAKARGVSQRVRFLGWRDDTAALFAAADIFVCPSRHEPFGNIVIEAWMQGVPIVAAASEGPGTLIEDGKSGILVPLEDEKAMADALAALARDRALAERLAEAGRQTYEAGYTPEVVVPRYIALFERLAG